MTNKEQFIALLARLNLTPVQERSIYEAASMWAEGKESTSPLTIMEQQNPECPLHGCHVAGEHHKVKVKVFGEVEHANYLPSDWNKVIKELAKSIQDSAPTPNYPLGSNTPATMTTVGENGQEVVIPPQYTAVAQVAKSHNVAVSENDGVLIVEPLKP